MFLVLNACHVVSCLVLCVVDSCLVSVFILSSVHFVVSVVAPTALGEGGVLSLVLSYLLSILVLTRFHLYLFLSCLAFSFVLSCPVLSCVLSCLVSCASRLVNCFLYGIFRLVSCLILSYLVV
jgi:hypothetical protein